MNLSKKSEKAIDIAGRIMSAVLSSGIDSDEDGSISEAIEELSLLSAIILAAYHFGYRVATYIIFLDFFQSFKIIVALRQLMETKRHQKMFGSLPDAYYYDSLLMRKYNWIWTNILISLLAIAAAPCLFSAGFQTMVKRFLRLLFFFLERLDRI